MGGVAGLSKALCARLRPADRDEVQAITGTAPENVMPDYLEAVATDPWPSTAMTMYANAGELAGICGIRALGSGIGSVWMVGTDVLDRHPIEFLRDSKAWLATQKSGWRVLANCVDARNAGHMAWLRWLGFEIEERTIPFGAEQRPFHPFRLNSSQREPCASQPFPP